MYAALAGIYQPGLKYAEAQKLAATLPVATRAALVAKAAAALPACYSQDFHACLHDQPNNFPGCADVLEGYVGNWDATDKLVNAVPYCAAPFRPVMLLGAAAALLIVGVGVGFALK